MLSILIAVAGVCSSYQILVLFRVPENLLTIANSYLKIIFIGVIPTFAYNSLTNIFRGVGDSKTPTYILIAATLINIVLDIFFITTLKWGVAGAAIATVIAQTFSFLTCMFYMQWRYPELFIRFWNLQLDRHELKKSLVIGTPAMLQQVFVSVGFMSIQFLINGFGTDCMAAYTAASKVDSFAEMPALNLGHAMTNFTAQNYGAKKFDRLKNSIKLCMTWSTVFCVIAGIILIVFANPIVSLFGTDAEMIALLVEALCNSGLKEFQISVGQIEYFKGLCAEAELDEETEFALREYISNRNEFGAQELLLDKNIPAKTIEALLNVNSLFGSCEVLDRALEHINNMRSCKAIERLQEVYKLLKYMA